MKNLLIACALIISLSSCGGKLYSYRKTVKVKSTEASNKKYNGATRAYFTIVSAPAASVSTATSVPPATASAAPVNVTPNTVYLTTKPVEEDKKEEEQKKKLSSTQPTSSAMVR